MHINQQNVRQEICKKSLMIRHSSLKIYFTLLRKGYTLCKHRDPLPLLFQII